MIYLICHTKILGLFIFNKIVNESSNEIFNFECANQINNQFKMRTRRQAKIEAEEEEKVQAKKNKPNKKLKKDPEPKSEEKKKKPCPSPKKEKKNSGKSQKEKRIRDKKSESPQKKDSSKKSEVKQKDVEEDSLAKYKRKKEKSEPQKDEIKHVIVKGKAPVDQHFLNKDKYHVLVHNDKVYSATLNQTNVSNNNNKYYILQILQSDNNPNNNIFFTRWGRVGTPGQQSTMGPYNIPIAIGQYDKKYRQKHKKGDYREVELNFGDDQEEEEEEENVEDKADGINQYMQSKLDKHVKNFVNLIFDIGMMNDHMKKIGYNINKMPLGKLSKQNILKGYNILKNLHNQVQKKKSNARAIEELTNDFYSIIPHDFGFMKMHNFILDTVKKVKDKLDMLQSLTEIKIATEILKKKEDGNRIDNNYKKLNRQLTYIERQSFTFKLINDYLQTTHASTHSSYKLQLEDLFEVQCGFENQRYEKDLHNKMLLWHGSRLTNYVGILSQGLRIAPPQAPVTGYMFGKGVYFADMSSKSANYCFTSRDNNTGILLLCEVALGEMNEKLHADYYASNLPDGKHSTKGMGRTAPQEQNYQKYKEVIVPMGPGKQTHVPGATLLYNEYIVYRLEQIRIKFILRTKFNYR